MSSGNIPGACAPSIRVSMPRSARTAMSLLTGMTMPVRLVTWSKSPSRVLSVTSGATASTTASGDAMGKGTFAITTRAPERAATNSSAFLHALYS